MRACFIFLVLSLMACATTPSPIASEAVIVRPDEPIERIALLACIKQEEPAPALQAYVDADPDLLLWTGDNIYVDTQDDPDAIYKGYQSLAAQPGFKTLRAMGYHLATWDDHDYGDNNEDRDYALKQDARQAFTRFWGEAGTPAEPEDGVYASRLFKHNDKRLLVIMLDVRWNRDAPGIGGDILGERQWSWLEEQLAVQSDLTLIVSGSQILLPEGVGSESWEDYEGAVQRLFDMIRQSTKNGVVFITGDQHYAEVARRDDALDYDAIEFQFAGVNQIEKPELNPWRVSAVNTSVHSLALIDIQWEDDRENLAHLLYKIVDASTGRVESIYRVNFRELVIDLPMTEQTVFQSSHLVQMVPPYPELEVRYTLDGSSPTQHSTLYKSPIVISESTQIRAAYFTASGVKRSRDFERFYEHAIPIPATEHISEEEGLRWSYWPGAFLAVPDFETLGEPSASGQVETLQVRGLAQQEDHYALRFEGYVKVPQTALYKVSTRSDDGSLVDISGRRVVENDGSHGPRTRSGLIALEAGVHPIEIGYFEDYAGEELSLRLALVGEDGSEEEIAVQFVH